MDSRKILSAILAGTLIGSSFLPGITDAEAAVPVEVIPAYAPPIKIQKFIGAESKVLAYMTRDYKKAAMNLASIDARRGYTDEYMQIMDRVKAVFSNAKYNYDDTLHMADLKKEIGTYKNLRREMTALSGTSNNPFAVSAQETAIVESGVTDFQKIFTSAMKKALDDYDSSDFKETGKMHLNAEGGFGKVDVSVEKYTKILSLLTRSQEADMTAKATFSLNMPGSYEYDETADDYKQIPGKTVSGDLRIDGSVKIIDQDLYLTLRDYSLNTSLTGKEKDALDQSMREFTQYKGKTVKISLPASSNAKMNQTEMLSQLKKILSILEENSLLTPYKKIEDTYALTLKDSTIQSIGAVYNEKIQASDLAEAKKEMQKMPLLYTNTAGKSTLFLRIDEKDASGTVSLSKENGEYSYLLDVKNPTGPESVHLLIKNGFAQGRLQADGFHADLSYRNQTLSITGEGFLQTITIAWPLSNENTNLDFTLNGKKVGNVTWKKVADTYTYDILFETTIQEILSKFHLNGESTVSKGTFPITAPKDFVEKKASDSEIAPSNLLGF